MTPREFAAKRLETEEGFSAVKYHDHLHIPTIGYGTRLPLSGVEQAHLHCGPDPEVLRERDCAWLLHHRAGAMFDEFGERYLNEVEVPLSIEAALLDMAYNIGVPRLMKFKRMLGAMREQRWEVSAVELYDSKYAIQLKNRANRNRWLILQAGTLPRSVDELYQLAGA